MPDRKIRNISKLVNPLPVHVRNEVAGKDKVVQLAMNEEFWCPNNLDTNSLAVYTRKGFLVLTEESKPEKAKYYESYPVGYWKINEEPEAVEEEKPIESSIARQKWEEADIEFLKKNYSKHGLVYCCEKLERSKKSVRKKIEALGLKRDDDKE